MFNLNLFVFTVTVTFVQLTGLVNHTVHWRAHPQLSMSIDEAGNGSTSSVLQGKARKILFFEDGRTLLIGGKYSTIAVHRLLLVLTRD